jgi:hypothetical protein
MPIIGPAKKMKKASAIAPAIDPTPLALLKSARN